MSFGFLIVSLCVIIIAAVGAGLAVALILDGVDEVKTAAGAKEPDQAPFQGEEGKEG